MDIPYTTVNIRSLLTAGHKALRDQRAEQEQANKGMLRGGSAGCIAGENIYGECHRIAHLRAIGIDKPVPASREIMFAGGEGNEDLWEQVLVPSWRGKVLRKTSLQQQGSWGVVKGSPDIVLADADDNWKVLLELKLISAKNSALYRELEGNPDGKHLIQAATYMWMSGTPAVLCYTSRTDFSLEFDRKKYGVAKIEPFYRMYYLSLRDDVLHWRDEYAAEEHATLITVSGIKAYYQAVHDMAYTYQLGERPTAGGVDGSPPPYNRCDARYCAFSSACDWYEGNYPAWLNAVKEEVAK